MNPNETDQSDNWYYRQEEEEEEDRINYQDQELNHDEDICPNN